MEEIYTWVPWFTELSQKVAEGGEQFLIDQVRDIDWTREDGDESVLWQYGDENIDPFSFINAVAFSAWYETSR